MNAPIEFRSARWLCAAFSVALVACGDGVSGEARRTAPVNPAGPFAVPPNAAGAQNADGLEEAEDEANDTRVSPDVIDARTLRPPENPPEGCVDEDDDSWPTCPGIETDFPQDCDDSEPRISPWAGPGCGDRDHNCNGIPDTEEPGGCTPGRSTSSRPGSDEVEVRRPLQPWPDGCIDEDGDGWPVCPGIQTDFPEDCDDSRDRVWPGAGPGCDGGDYNCNGVPDTEEPGGCTPGRPGGGGEQ